MIGCCFGLVALFFGFAGHGVCESWDFIDHCICWQVFFVSALTITFAGGCSFVSASTIAFAGGCLFVSAGGNTGSGALSSLSLYVLLWSIIVICFNVSVLVLLSGANGFPVFGCWSACNMSMVALAMISAADVVGSFSFLGNHISVSAILSCLVSVIHVQ